MGKRASTLVVDSHTIDVVLDAAASGTYRCRTTIRFSCEDAATYADLRASVVESATLNGRPLDITRVWDGARLELTGLGPSNVVEVDALLPYSTDERGLLRATDPDGTTYLYNVNSPDATARVFCCFDDHDLRAQVDLHVSVPEGWTALVTETTWPVAPYLVVVAAGPWSLLHHGSIPSDDVPLAVYTQRSRSGERARAGQIADLMTRSVRYFEDLLETPYPYAKCEAVFVRDLPQLALSVPGLIVFADDVFEPAGGDQYDLTVVGHEVAHAWIGCLVDSGEDSWLVEACATYLARTAVLDLLPGSRPWDDADAPDAYYARDAELIRRLEDTIGRANVLRGLGLCCRRFAHRNPGRAELAACWTEVSGRDVSDWAADRQAS